MKRRKWNQRFFSSTRGRIVALLRSSGRTVNELADALQLSDNAVRAHLASLERDGLVQQSGTRRGLRKPHYAYQLTPEAEALFPRAYDVLLNQLLAVLGQRLPGEVVEETLREVGRRLAAGHLPEVQDATLKERVEASVRVLGELGGLAKIQQQNGHFLICSASCPLSAVVAEHPQACVLAEALLEELTGVRVQERCNRDGAPQCHFEIGAAA